MVTQGIEALNICSTENVPRVLAVTTTFGSISASPTGMSIAAGIRCAGIQNDPPSGAELLKPGAMAHASRSSVSIRLSAHIAKTAGH